jgi:hypothetical protein
MGANPIRQIEEAIFLLRRQDARAWLQYLLAAAPFLLTLLAFFHDMSAGFLGNRCALESLACALAFFWAAAWKAKFGATLLATMNGPGPRAPQGSFWRALYLQSIFQTIKLVVFPLALVSIVPIAWTSSFFRNASIEAGLADSSLRGAMAKSARRASVNGRANWIGISILSVIYLVTFINVYLLAGLLPLLLRTFSGVETLFTRDVKTLLGFNIFCIVVAVTWLIVDPLVLAYTVVRCFYAEARTDARDLLALLRPVAAVAILILALVPPCRSLAAQNALTKEKLSQAVQEAAKSDDYGWLRAQRQASSGEENGFFASLNRDINSVFRAIGSWVSGIRNWLRRLLEKGSSASPSEPDGAPVRGDVRWLLYALAALVVVAAIFVVWRSANRLAEPGMVSSTAIQTPDLSKENVLASDLPEEEWLRLAREFLAKGELRLAVRALYLSNLSYLGSQQFIQIARSKSNSIYERELRLRPRSSELSAPFAQANRSFERAWYGFHEVTPEFVDVFQQNVEAIRQHAKG